MQGIEITLLRNKQFIAQNSEDYKVIGNENNATTIIVHFPDEYENYSKRVDFKNIKNEKWTISLYTPEDETKEYGVDFDKKNFIFTLPSAVTIKGELKVQFIAYLPDESETFVPFEILKIEVKDDIMYVKKKGSQNPDLILQAYEYSNMALGIARESLTRTLDAERAALEAEKSAKEAQTSAKASEQSSLASKQSADAAKTSAKNAETSATAAQNSAKNAENSASQAKTNSDYAVNTSNTANTKSTNAVNTANTANEKSTKVLEIVDNLTVSSNEIDCTEHISVEIETNSSNKRKNIKFNVPAPKQGVSFRAKGPWESTINYVNNDFYIDTVSIHGCTYFCKKTNTDKQPVPSEESEYWGIIALKGSDAGFTIIDDLNSTHIDYVLSANQGRVLKELISTSVENAIAQLLGNAPTNRNTLGSLSDMIDNIITNKVNIVKSDGSVQLGNGTNTTANTLQFKGYQLLNANGKVPAPRLLDTIYPVGSIYLSVNSTNPSALFGGTWEQLKDRFLLGAGSTYGAGITGGEANHLLTENEMPKHIHTLGEHRHGLSTTSATEYNDDYDWVKPLANNAGGGAHPSGVIAEVATGSSWAKRYVEEYANAFGGHIMSAANGNTGEKGGNVAHNNMPPYLAVYMWKRTA